MFEHKDIEKYDFEEVPLDQDIFLMGGKWIGAYDKALLDGLSGKEWTYPGYISYAAARHVSAQSIELSWYPNIHDRFHEIRVRLPRSSFLCCVGCRNYDEKPHIFVTDEWLTDLHSRANSVFVLVDAAGVKAALVAGTISNAQLIELRALLDSLAAANPDIAFVSFADSLLLKNNWSVGQWDAPTRAPYRPERVLSVLPNIADAYRTALGLDVYAVVTQGRNEFYDQELMHISPSQNHISLNSLGISFAQLQAIELAARAAMKRGDHPPATLYMDDQFFHSLNWVHGFDKSKEPSYAYQAPMTAHPCSYVAMDLSDVLQRLRNMGAVSPIRRTHEYRSR